MKSDFPAHAHSTKVAAALPSSQTGPTLSFTKRSVTSGLTYAIEQSNDLGVTNPRTEVTGPTYLNNARPASRAS